MRAQTVDPTDIPFTSPRFYGDWLPDYVAANIERHTLPANWPILYESITTLAAKRLVSLPDPGYPPNEFDEGQFTSQFANRYKCPATERMIDLILMRANAEGMFDNYIHGGWFRGQRLKNSTPLQDPRLRELTLSFLKTRFDWKTADKCEQLLADGATRASRQYILTIAKWMFTYASELDSRINIDAGITRTELIKQAIENSGGETKILFMSAARYLEPFNPSRVIDRMAANLTSPQARQWIQTLHQVKQNKQTVGEKRKHSQAR